jgi:hypothetical protein
MPGNVQLALPVGVFPFRLCKAYQRQKKYEMRVNWFPDGRQIRQAYDAIDGDQSVWSLTTRLKPTDQQTLLGFYDARKGTQVPFYFYDMDESGYVYDGTGSLTTGRYIVRFQGTFNLTYTRPRVETAFNLIQIA